MAEERRSAAAAAAERVREVLEAAERSAAELRADTAREIEAQLETAQEVSERMSARAERIERALETLAGTITEELNALRADLEELRAVSEGVAERRTEAEPAPAAPAAEPAPAEPPPGDGHEGARVIALNMALNGSSREETARYLAENFELDDPDALLDEVYARVGR